MADSLSSQGVLGAAEASVLLSVAGLGGVAFQVQGTFSGTITFEATVQGQDFAAFRVVPVNSSTPTTTTTGTGLFVGSAVGFLSVRARMSSYVSGAATVLIRADVSAPGGAGGGGGTGSDVNLIEVGGQSIALGETTMANSLPVVIASDQTPVPITGSISASNPSVSATGSAAPSDATYVGILDPSSGNLEGLVAERLDYDTGAGTVAQTGFGLLLPASGGPIAALGGSGTSTGALRVELASNGTGRLATVDAVTAITNPVTVAQATAANLNATVVGTGTFAVQVSSALPAGTNYLGNVGTGQVPKWKTGSASATFTVVAAVTSKKVKVYALSLMTVSSTAVTVTFKDGAAGTALATYVLQASANVTNGIAEAVSIPSTLFETSAGTLLEMAFSAAVSVTYNLRYYEEA